jgi:hypothetical protein
MYNTSWVAKPRTEVTVMVRVASLFSQLLSLIPRTTFQQLVAKHGAENPATRTGIRSIVPTPAGFGIAGTLRNRPPRPLTGKTSLKNIMISRKAKSS